MPNKIGDLASGRLAPATRYYSGVTKTVKSSGGDYTTIQEAIDYFKNIYLAGNNQIQVDAGTYTLTSALDFYNLTGSLTIVGDTRTLAGVSWMDSADVFIYNKSDPCGAGTVTLSNSGNDITVACSSTNPNFTGWGNGDKILITTPGGSSTKYTISSISSNTITLTTTAPSVTATGTILSMMPNRILNPSSVYGINHLSIDSAQVMEYTRNTSCVKFVGFYFGDTSGSGYVFKSDKWIFENCHIGNSSSAQIIIYGPAEIIFSGGINTLDGELYAYKLAKIEYTTFCKINRISIQNSSFVTENPYLTSNGAIYGDKGSVTITLDSYFDCHYMYFETVTYGLTVSKGSKLICYGLFLEKSGNTGEGGILADNYSYASLGGQHDVNLNGFKNGSSSYAFKAIYNSEIIIASGAIATNNTYAYRAEHGSHISANGSNANNSGNTTNYSPGTSNALTTSGAQTGSFIEWS